MLGLKTSRPKAPVAPNTPERKVLAGAIEAMRAAQAARDAALATEDPAQRAVRAAEDALEDARERLRTAKGSAAESATAATLAGDVVELPASLRAARTALADAEDRLEVARAVRDRLNSRRVDIDADITRAQSALRAARDAVVKAEGALRAKALTAELVQGQHRMAAIVDELNWLINAGAVPLSEEHGFRYSQPADESLRRALGRLDPSCLPLVGDELVRLVPSPTHSSLWAAAASELERDSAAPLPAP